MTSGLPSLIDIYEPILPYMIICFFVLWLLLVISHLIEVHIFKHDTTLYDRISLKVFEPEIKEDEIDG